MNDIQSAVMGVLNIFKTRPKEELLNKITQIIEQFHLSQSQINGYEDYNCDSKVGLGPYNKERFLCLREKFNQLQEKDQDYYIMLYVLIIYSFNNQIRFNRNGEFNLPVGKRDFNKNMEKKFNKFIDRIQSIDCEFSNKDFRNALDCLE